MKNLISQETEKKILDWIVSKRYRIALLVLLGFVIANLTRIPYINLFLTKETSFLILLVLTLAIAEVNTRRVFNLGIFLFLPEFLFQIAGRVEIAEFLGNVIYSVFLLGVIKGVVGLKNGK